ncbi:MAG: bifunctional adenosylcobinamide kinase/adenosylcobinamide-phosphate guanylyltransferase [Pseudomonadota bacterium]
MTLDQKVTLVLGGVSSGKSAYAEALFEGITPRHYVATAQAFDDEMREKIKLHQEARSENWITHEEPLALANLLTDMPAQIVLVDCLSMWLSNHLLAENDLDAEFEALGAAIAKFDGQIVFVSNEVGFAPVVSNTLGRAFQKAQGELNQRIAALSDRVVLISAGLPMVLK